MREIALDNFGYVTIRATAGATRYEGSGVAVGDDAGQAEAGMETLEQGSASAGATLEDVISTRVLAASSAQADLVEAGTDRR
ncbi:MAG: hypothetical protein ABF811_00455 [Pseudoclavibacter sp.]